MMAAATSVSPIPTVIPGGSISYETVGDTGAKTLWVVFTIMLLASVAFTGLAWNVPVSKRLFHVLTTFITVFAAISYFAMATGDGNGYTHVIVKEVHKNGPDNVEHVYRQIFWARYIDWSVTTPLLLLDLGFLAGMNGADLLIAIVADVIMILTGLFAAFGSTDGQKWGWYAISCFAYLVVLWQLVISGRRAVLGKDNSTGKLFATIGGFTLILWTLYPVVWALGEGTRQWSVDGEIVAYAILDVLAKPIFGFWLLVAHGRNATAIDGFWSHGLGTEGALRVGEDD